MLLKYINRKSNLDLLSPTPCAQLVNVPQLLGCTRCFYCRFREDFQSPQEYSDCMRKHKCGEESLLYAYLNNSRANTTPPVAEHFSPTQVIKSLTIDNMTRYIQLWSCDLSGYECCRLCQFYASRVASDVSIADCSNSHTCGRNGSWWDLLVIRDQDIVTLPDIFSSQPPSGSFYTLDEVLHTASFSEFILDPDGYIVVRMSDGNTYFPMAMVKNTPLSWRILEGTDNDARTWSFWQSWNPTWFPKERTMLISGPSNPVFQALSDRMFDEQQWFIHNKAWWRTTSSNNLSVLFTYVLTQHSEQVVGGNILVTINDVNLYNDYCICNNGTLQFLALPYAGAPINKARWVKLTSAQVETLTYVTSRKMNTPSAGFLIALGVRQSLFY